MPRGGRNIPSLQQRFALKGKLLVKKYKGQLVVQSWPKPYGPPRSAAQANTIEAFKRFQRAVKFFPPQQIITAMELTKGTGMYPRDLMMAASLGTNVMLGYDELGAHPMIGDGLQKFIAAGGETSIVWSNIPPGYSTLAITIFGRSLKNATFDTIGIQFNGDTGAHYDGGVWNRFGQFPNQNNTVGSIGELAAATAPGNYPSTIEATIPGYSAGTFQRMAKARTDRVESGTGFIFDPGFFECYWRNTAPINTLTLIIPGGLAAGTTATLYGLF